MFLKKRDKEYPSVREADTVPTVGIDSTPTQITGLAPHPPTVFAATADEHQIVPASPTMVDWLQNTIGHLCVQTNMADL